jgi:membrane-bound lytic murein transglycosylase D
MFASITGSLSMLTSGPQEPDPTPSEPACAVLVRVIRGEVRESEKRFTATFVVGRSKECNFQILDTTASRRHLQIICDGARWRLKDLESANGTFLDGVKIEDVPLPDHATIELGKGGALLSLTVEKRGLPSAEKPPPTKQEFTTETQIIQHYLDSSSKEQVGTQTMLFRRAFKREQKRKSRKYKVLIGVVLLLLLVAGGVIVYQTNKLRKLRATAENIFYAMKDLQLQVAKLEELVLQQAEEKQAAEILEKRAKVMEMEKEYEGFVKELEVYYRIPEDEQIILRVARIFGECDVAVPQEFVAEVKRYIKIWQSTDRLERALRRAKQKGYTRLFPQMLAEQNLQPQFFFLPLQESNFDERAIGPETRYGYAKGMWQFIAETAIHYGLRIGPYSSEAVYDPSDDRFNVWKSTVAALNYLRDLNNNEAQASGLLVMASYNWGENNIRQIISRMPENPRERNFWRLLSHKNIPRETYDYVFSIFSAAVICENQSLFGFKGECPEIPASK